MLEQIMHFRRARWWLFAALILFLMWNAALMKQPIALAQPGPTPFFTPTPFVFPQTFNVPCDSAEFEYAVASANNYGGDDVINLTAGCHYYLSTALFIGGQVKDTITINGNGATIVAEDSYRTAHYIYVVPDETLILNNLTIRNGDYGIINSTGTLSLTNVTVGWNKSGGISNTYGTVTITDSTIINNGLSGIEDLGGTITLNRTRVVGNGYTGVYGGITSTAGTVMISESSITGNGIGISSYTNGAGGLAISRTTIANNTAAALDIRAADTSVMINNSTISGNGPSVFEADPRRVNVMIRNSTITANKFGNQVGTLELGSYVDLTLENTVVAGNSVAANEYDITVFPYGDPEALPATVRVLYEGNNFIGSINPVFSVFGTTNRLRTGNPALLALADNGAFGQTHKPSLSSPLLDAGACSASFDQRGISRPIDLPGINNALGAGTGTCDIGAMEVDVLAVNDSYTAVFETPLNVPAPGILTNDGVSNVALALVSPAVNGQLTLNNDGSFSYVPNTGFLGSDSFTYNFIRNGSESNTARVLIDVVAPIASDDIYTVGQGQTLNVPAPGVLANDKNPASLIANIAEPPLNGTVTLNQDGSFTYIPNSNFSGADRFTYTAARGEINSSPARVVISVTGSGADGETIFNPPPSNLRIDGSLFQTPVILTFRWDVTTSRTGQEILNEYHNLRITDDVGTVLYEEWLPAAQICTGLSCEKTLDEENLTQGAFTNGFYRWRVQTWTSGIFSRESDERGFEVNVTTPTLLSGDIEIDTTSGRPVILFPDNPNALWYQIFIGERTNDGLALRHLRWYKKDQNICANGVCRFYPTSNPITGNYELWVQTWGPAGFGIGDIQTELGGWAGPIPFSMDFSPPQPPIPLTVSYADSGRPQFSWQHPPASTWFQLWTFDDNDPATYYTSFQWVASLDAGCLESLTCTFTPDFVLGNNRTYQWYVQTWGPGGFASKGNPNDPFDRWVRGIDYEITAEAPAAPQAITPTKVVTKPQGLTYTWGHQAGISWYQFEIEQTDDLPVDILPVTYNNWYPNEALGCRDAGQVCVLEVLSLLLPDGAYQWRLRGWNPAVLTLSDDQWSEWVPFTVTRG